MKTTLFIIILGSLVTASAQDLVTDANSGKDKKEQKLKDSQKNEKELQLKMKELAQESAALKEKNRKDKVPEELVRDIGYVMPIGSKARKGFSYKINEEKSTLIGHQLADGESPIQPGDLVDPKLHPQKGWLKCTGLLRKWGKGYLFKTELRTYRVFDRQTQKLINYHLEKNNIKVGKEYQVKVDLEGIWMHNFHDNNGFWIVGIDKVSSLKKLNDQ